MYIVAPSILNI